MTDVMPAYPTVVHAWDDYLAETQEARAQYDRALGRAKAQRDVASATAHAEYQVACDKVFEAYNAAAVAAWHEYEQSTSRARLVRDYAVDEARPMALEQ